ncbi:MAG: TonB-dependent receptor plug domain-containing protein [Muribaculaceae bacterium]|nr:TonB-dependent receptor plug domain-containing protein [Muribaculaceae bacterium]
MKRLLTFITVLAMTLAVSAQRELDEVVVRATRPLSEIGVHKTVFDSVALKQSVAQSMADVLSNNSALFVKNYGRATLSTVSFRGTSPSHTQVTWNGMKLTSPMLGMTDFSTIPSFFIDNASLLHGTSSVNETGGGLGGAVRLATATVPADGWQATYTQGIGSFSTFDEFAKVGYGDDRWGFSTRIAYASSPNDYKYVNHDKKENIYDDNHNIIDQYHPTERNRSGQYHDFNILQELRYSPNSRNNGSLAVWYTNSSRHLPLLTTDYTSSTPFLNRQHEQSLRAVVSWRIISGKFRTDLRAGYTHTAMAYDYQRDPGNGIMAVMTRSRSYVNSFYEQAELQYVLSSKWIFTAGLTAYEHLVASHDMQVNGVDGVPARVGYDKHRTDLSGALTLRWQPTDRLGLSAVVRQESYGEKIAPPIPAFFTDFIILRSINLVAKGSVSRNYHHPSLNDQYFMPGGNINLRSEKGVTYDLGTTFAISRSSRCAVEGGVTWFDSRITDWISWLPTTKGFFSPRNVGSVHAYGIESNLRIKLVPAKEWDASVSFNYSWTPSINKGPAMSEGDRSVGQQLPYIPRHSATANGSLSYRSWTLTYTWNYYSRRFTMTSNENTITGALPTYFMNNLILEKKITTRPLYLNLKLAVNNLFNEDYVSVLSRPMPGINYEFFITFTPRLKNK